MPDTGRPIKYYYLTDQGWKLLLESEDDMRKRIDNHLFFLDELEKAKNRKK